MKLARQLGLAYKVSTGVYGMDDGSSTTHLLSKLYKLKVFYSGYINGVRSCSGAQADLDGNELEPGRVLEFVLTSYLFDEDADLSKFSIDFSPYDNKSQYELGRTNAVAFPAEYGQTYRIHLVQDETGYYAVLE